MTLEQITPEMALMMYRPLVDNATDEHPAMAIMIIEHESGIVEQVGMPYKLQLSLASYIDLTRDDPPVRVLLSAETWVRHHSLETGEETGLEEAVNIIYKDRAGNDWEVEHKFARRPEGVRWYDDLRRNDKSFGPVHELLAALIKEE